MKTRCFVVLVLVAACTSNEPTKRELCEQLEDRVVEQRVKTITASAPDPYAAGSAFGTKPPAGFKPVGPDVEGHRSAMKQALGSAYVDSCVDKLSEKQLKCALVAADAEAVANCQTAAN